MVVELLQTLTKNVSQFSFLAVGNDTKDQLKKHQQARSKNLFLCPETFFMHFVDFQQQIPQTEKQQKPEPRRNPLAVTSQNHVFIKTQHRKKKLIRTTCNVHGFHVVNLVNLSVER